MPIYEFYCSDCHRIFNFLSRTVNTERHPNCPKCGRAELEREVSLFAISKGRKEGEDDAMPNMDEAKLEQAMQVLAREAEGMNEEDPRQAARLMRRLFDATGLQLGSGMEEAMRRMEAGEDPDQIEEELGDQLEGEDGTVFGPTGSGGLRALRRRLRAPAVDPTLHEL